uniref:Uncharacterized protein n=1 Tax=Cacopsylla melanoneura TaxID=428564 RepID=A0A8D9BUE0_9HEMI
MGCTCHSYHKAETEQPLAPRMGTIHPRCRQRASNPTSVPGIPVETHSSPGSGAILCRRPIGKFSLRHCFKRYSCGELKKVRAYLRRLLILLLRLLVALSAREHI